MIDYPVRFEVAFGADPADPDSWTWTDLSGDLIDQTVVIKRGRADEASTPAATSAKFVVDNQTGDYTPTRRASIHWPNIRRGTPVRFSVWYDDAWEVRFVGFAESWTPTWPHGDLSGGDYLGESFVTIDCAGPLRRLASNRAMVSDAPASSVVAQWAGGAAVLFGGTESSVAGVAPLEQVPKPGWTGGGAFYTVYGYVPTHTNPTVFTAWAMHSPSAAIHSYDVLDVRTSGFVWRWLVTVTPTLISLYRTTSISGSTFVASAPNVGPYGSRRIALSVAQTTADRVTWRIIYTNTDQPADGTHIADFTGTIDNTPNPLGRITQLVADASIESYNIHELTATIGDMDWDAEDRTAVDFAGETAGRRIERVAGLYGVPFTAVGDLDETEVLHAQGSVGPAQAVLDAAKTDMGVLSEDVDGPGITYRCREYNRQPAAALTARSDLLDPFVPVLDDQRFRNVVTVTPAVGAKATVEVDGLGGEERREESLSLSLPSHQAAVEQAGWRLRLASSEEMRYPTVTAEMSAAWVDVRCGDRLTVSGLPPQHPTDVADVLVEGWTETITNTRWTIQANCSPAAPWDIGLLGTDRCDTDGATLDDLVAQVARITTAAHYLSAPDAAPLDIVGDIDVRWDGALTDWTAAADQVLVAKGNSFVVNQRSYQLYVSTTGVPTLTWSTNGTATVTATSTAALPTTNGERVRIRATLDVDDGAGNRVIRFYTSTDFADPLETATDWTQLGSTVTAAGTTSIHSGTGSLTVGALVTLTAGLLGAVGDHYAAAVLTGIAGTPVAAPDFSDPTQTTVGGTTATDGHGDVFTLLGTDVDIVAHHEAVVTTTTGPTFDPASVPFDIDIGPTIGAETATVTAINRTASPQTFTLTRADPLDHTPGESVVVADSLTTGL